MIARALDEADLRKVDSDWDPRNMTRPSPAKLPYPVVRRVVAEEFKVLQARFLERRAFRDLVWPRFGLIFWVRAYCKEPMKTRAGVAVPMSYPAIATRLNILDHTTVIHGQRRAQELWRSDADFAQKMDRCWARFKELTHAA